MTEEINVQEIVNSVSRHMNSAEGRRQLEGNLRAAEETNNQLREAEKVPRDLLYEPMTI